MLKYRLTVTYIRQRSYIYNIKQRNNRVMKAQVKKLRKGDCINHHRYGVLQYNGLATKNPYTNEPKVPHVYVFWQPVDENGCLRPDIIEKDGDLLVEVI